MHARSLFAFSHKPKRLKNNFSVCQGMTEFELLENGIAIIFMKQVVGMATGLVLEILSLF